MLHSYEVGKTNVDPTLPTDVTSTVFSDNVPTVVHSNVGNPDVYPTLPIDITSIMFFDLDPTFALVRLQS